MATLPELPASYGAAMLLIDEAHALDPRTAEARVGAEGEHVPYELHYARKMTRWLAVRSPGASPVLQLACRAQHFRRWEIPRSSYPMTRAGYLTWRAKLKAQAAAQVAELLSASSGDGGGGGGGAISPADVDRVAALIRKENLGSDGEAQALEDVACLVFLDDQFDGFESKPELDEDKVVGILRKTWAKMSAEGRALALQMDLSERAKALIGKALEG
ncbi:hypothetical protein RB598_002802 [Gaeumannomyces tritici]